MDKQQARNLISETFEKPFDKNRFTHFIKNLLNRIEEAPFAYHGQFIPEAYRQYISTLERIGKYHDGENRIDILVIKLQRKASLERARTNQRNFVAGYLQGKYGSSNEKEAALVAFVSPDEQDWRFSLVRMDYKFEQTPTGKTKVKEEFTPVRRWSFLVGANENSHTAQSRLVKILADDEHNPTLAKLEEAFNIETVTKEFFLKYRDLFIRTKEALDKVIESDARIKDDFKAKDVNAVDFAKKLLGQIVFLYFLQKKGWFGVSRGKDWGEGDRQFLRHLFVNAQREKKNYFNRFLEPLFYEALRLERPKDYYDQFECRIPFLNGGLFDPINEYDWQDTDIEIPNEVFSNTCRTKEGDTGDGILDVFDRYNFTVKEDEPLEKEVAIDPELLGKAYEKFNAIRPDNFEEYKKALKSGKKGDESKFNKQFGVYYTPREIVHYMCQQSLINYLATELSSVIPSEARNLKQDIETLIHLGEQVSENEATAIIKQQRIDQGKQQSTKTIHQLPESIRNNAKLIDDKLENITVCDPAVGSGAFPVGMMSEIVKARNVLSTFIQDEKRTTYDFKRQCIEHSLYGVDIDPGAVEIAKLRLWLSLVVDEESIENIKPLPNLDYKIMQGNSLIELLSTEALTSTRDNKRTELVKELRTAKDELFNITIPTQKEKKRHEIDMLMKQLFEYDRDKQIERLKDDVLAVKSQQRLFEDEKDRKEDEKKIREIESKIQELKNIDIPGPKEHYEWHINYSEIFQEKGGFDVVIGNPPYVRVQNLSHEIVDLYKRIWSTAWRRIDISTLFMELGYSKLDNKGHLCYVSSNQFIATEYGRMLRKFLLQKAALNFIVDFGDLPIFENAQTYVSIFMLSKNQKSSFNYHKVIDLPFRPPLQFANIEFSTLSEEIWSLGKKEQLSIIKKIQKDSKPLKKYAKCWAGIITGNDGLLLYDIDKKISFIEEDLLIPVIRAQGCFRYGYATPSKKVFYPYYENYDSTDLIKMDALMKEYPKAYAFIKENEKKLKSRKDSRTTFGEKKGWYGLIRFGRLKTFKKPKIVSPGEVKENKFSLDLTGSAFSCARVFSITSEDEKLDLKYLLAILNSRLIEFYLHKNAPLKQGGYFTYSSSIIDAIPLKFTVRNQPFVSLVDQILAITKDDDYQQNPQKQTQVKALEREIDQMVYELYGLTADEIGIVEGIR